MANITTAKIPNIPSIAAFRSNELWPGYGSPIVYLQGGTSILDGAQAFYSVSLTDKTTADNGTTCLVDLSGNRWFQVTSPETPSGLITVPEGGTGVATLASGGFVTGADASPVTITVPGAGVTAFIVTPTSANLAAAVTDETGSGPLVFATSPTFTTPLLGTPTSGNLVNTTGYAAANLSGLGAGVATFLATPSSANLAAAVTNETGSGALVFSTSPTLVTPILGTPTSGDASNLTNIPVANATGTLGLTHGGTGQTAAPAAFDSVSGNTGARLLWKLIGCDLNASGDQAFTKVGTFTNWIRVGGLLTNVSTSLTTAVGGTYTAASKGGINVNSAQVLAAANGVNTGVSLTFTAAGAGVLSNTVFNWNNTVLQGGAATADVYIYGIPLS